MKSKEEQIDNYLFDLLSREEKEKFEDLMHQDPELMQEVTAQRDIVRAIQMHGRKMERAQFDTWEHENSRKSKTAKKKTWFAVAASAAILLISGYFFLAHEKQNLYDTYYTNFPNYAVSSTRDQIVSQDELREAFEYYDNQDWPKARRALKSYLSKAPYNPDITFYLGLSLQADGRHKEALDVFNNVQDNRFQFSNALLWYRSLSLLAIDEKEEAEKILKELVAENSSTYSEKGRELLTKITSE